MLQAMASHDAKDSTSSDVPLQDVMAAVGQGVKGMKIGVPREYVMDGMDPDVMALWQQGQDWLRQAGAELVECLSAAYKICTANLLYHCAG